MGQYVVDVMQGDALVTRSKVNADRFIDAARQAAKRPVREGRKQAGEWLLVTHYVSDRTEAFEFGD